MSKGQPTRRGKDTLVLGLAVVLLALGVFLARPKTATPIGVEMPDISVPLIANGAGELNLALQWAETGELTVLEFFASWCRNCERSLPGLERAAAASRVRWLAVSVDDEVARARGAVTRWGLSSPVGFDSDGRLARYFGVSVLPTTVIVGGEGRVTGFLPGSISEAQLTEALRGASE